MKYSEILFGILRVPVDLFAALLALVVAYRLREANIDLLPGPHVLAQPSNLPPFGYYLQNFAVPSVIAFVAIVAGLQLYNLRSTLGVWRELARIVLASLLWISVVMAWFFLIEKQLFFSRALLIIATIFITLFVLLGRSVITLLQRACLRHGIGARAVASFGSQGLPGSIRGTLEHDIRYRYVGHMRNLGDLDAAKSGRMIDLVLHTDPSPTSNETNRLIDHCRAHHIGYAFLPPVFVDVPHQLSMQRLGMMPLLKFEPTPLDGWGRVIKRGCDVALGAMLLLIAAPILLLAAIAILVTSGRPIFYVSRRVGQHGNSTVPVLKFRTMVKDADARKPTLSAQSHRNDGPLFKVRRDPRVTPIGRLLRRFSIDELPQLLNVIVGQLALVGPRPHLPDEVSRYREEQRRVFAVRPGVTGLAQISGRSNLSFEDEIRYDMRYIEEWSLLLDLWILWRTVFVVMLGRGAD